MVLKLHLIMTKRNETVKKISKLDHLLQLSQLHASRDLILHVHLCLRVLRFYVALYFTCQRFLVPLHFMCLGASILLFLLSLLPYVVLAFYEPWSLHAFVFSVFL